MNKQWMTLVIVVVLVGLVLGARFSMRHRPKPIEANTVAIPAVPQISPRTEGNPHAKVKITEFIDFQCPACAHGIKILRQYFQQHPNDIYIRVKYFPLTSLHSHAMQSALYSECAARQGKFWPLNNVMIDQQQQWSGLTDAGPVFDAMAAQVGIDVPALKVCVASESASQVINNEKSQGQALGISSTPTYFINGQMVVGTKSLEDELNKYFPSDSK